MKRKTIPFFTLALLLPAGQQAWSALLLDANFNATDGGFVEETLSGTAAAPWTWDGSGAWAQYGENSGPVNDALISPAVNLAVASAVQITFDHRYSFEATFDGGAVQYSVNGGAWLDVPPGNFTQNGYPAAPIIGLHDLLGKRAFNSTSPGFQDPANLTSIADLPSLPAGTSLKVRFLAAWDANTIGDAPNWEIDSVKLETLPDTDGDGMPDAFEDANGLNKAVNDAALDPDADGSTNLQEYNRRTKPQVADTDGDGYKDGAETGTGIWVSAADTGSDPLVADTDGDGLRDGLENPTQASTGLTQPGSDPNKKDTDGDGWDDYTEATFNSDPKLTASKPTLNALPLHLLAWWNFNDVSQADTAVDASHSIVGKLEGGAVFTDDAVGRTGAAGDRALDLGAETVGGRTMRVPASTFLNLAGARNQVSVSFWQKLDNVASSTTFRAGFAPAAGDTRGISCHSTWGDNTFYWDTSGCCEQPSQRLLKANAGVDLTDGWHHLVFQKNGPLKEIWLDGALVTSSGGASPLPTAFTNLFIGSSVDGTENIHGMLDDVAIFAEALTEAQIQRLSAGDTPASLLPSADDADGDGMLDVYEDANGLNKNNPADRDTDLDNDGSTNFQEFTRGTKANNPDTDGDGLADGVETGTAVWVSTTSTGTDPLNPDSDGDGLGDSAETNTGIYVSLTNTGTDPNKADTDGDALSDGYELTVTNTNPSSAASPAFGSGSGIGIAFTGNPGTALLGAEEIAGFAPVSQKNWNVTDGLAAGDTNNVTAPSAGKLVNAAGAVTTTTVSWVAETVYNAPNGTASPNSKLINGYIDNTDASPDELKVAFAGIPYPAYDVYVYFGSDGNGRTGSISIPSVGEKIQYTTNSSKGAAPGFKFQDFIPSTSTTAPGPLANFAVFRNYSGAALVVQLNRGSNNSGIHGIQIAPIADTDGDGISDSYEDANGLDKNSAADKDSDPDGDGLTNLQEFVRHTKANLADSDGDGLNDKVETNTGTWVSATDTGSNPLNPDTDGDYLLDGVENLSLAPNGLAQPGSDPNKADTDGDFFGDYVEAAYGSNPRDLNSVPVLDSAPLHLLAWWPFNDASNPARVMDVSHSLIGSLPNAGAFSADSGGRTSQPGDRALDVKLPDGGGKGLTVAMGEFLNIASEGDAFAFSFWLKQRSVTSNFAVFAESPSSNGDARGISAHVTWSDNTFYYDTAGCCDGGQRISIAKPGDLDMSLWHHYVFQKNGPLKEIWVDGQLLHFNDPDSNPANPLPIDFTRLYVGGFRTGNSIDGFIDDFAVYAEALTESQIGILAGGAAPTALLSTLPPGPEITAVNFVSASRTLQLTWKSTAGKQYRVERSKNLILWQTLTSTHPSGGASTTYSDANLPGTETRYYYRIAEM